MKYPECKNVIIDLEELGANRNITIEDLVSEVIRNRRKTFFDALINLKNREICDDYCFDAITFKSAIADFYEFFDENRCSKNYEGTMEYDIIADMSSTNCTWHCRTTITWRSALPLALGILDYHTEILSTAGVEDYINSMNGTSMRMVMTENSMNLITSIEALQRTNKAIQEKNG